MNNGALLMSALAAALQGGDAGYRQGRADVRGRLGDEMDLALKAGNFGRANQAAAGLGMGESFFAAQEQAVQRQQEQARRQQAQDQAKQLRELLQARRAAKDFAGAQALLPQYLEAQNQGFGLNLVGPKFAPGQPITRTVEKQTPKGVIHAPLTTRGSEWDVASNVAQLDSAIGYTPPPPKVVAANGGLYVVDQQTGAVTTLQAPPEKLTTVPEGSIVVNGSGKVVAQGKPKSFAPRTSGRGGTPSFTTVPVPDGQGGVSYYVRNNRTGEMSPSGVQGTVNPRPGDGGLFSGGPVSPPSPAPVPDPIAEWAAQKLKQNR